MPKLVYIVTASMTADHLLRGQLSTMRRHGFEVTVIVAPNPELAEIAKREGVKIIAIPMQREINLKSDLLSLWRIYRQLCILQPDIVNASTPKAGLLGMMAAWLANIPIRVYVLRGLRLETTSGFQRLLLTLTERIAASCAHQVVCVSHSLYTAYADLRQVPNRKLTVLGKGSSNGVIAEHFLPSSFSNEQIKQLRQHLTLPPDVPVIGFVGRFTRDKGIVELVEAFEHVLTVVPEAYLLLVGRFEKEDPVPLHVIERIQSHPQIKQAGFVADTAPYYQLMEILAFPSYREGFPNVPLEAAVAGVPTVGFSATGTVDAVQHGKTGLLVPIGATDELAKQILHLLQDTALRHKMSMTAQQWAIENFSAQTVWENWAAFFHHCIDQQSQSRESPRATVP